MNGKRKEAIDYVSDLVDNTLSLENDILTKRKLAILESALTTNDERALLEKVKKLKRTFIFQ